MEQKTDAREARIRKASRSRREQEKEELRQTILKAAGDLFLERGYERFSMRHLAESIGYSAATLYLYFRDKDDLLFTVVDEGYKRFARMLTGAAMSHEDPWERLIALSEAYVTFGLQNPVYYQLMFMSRVDYLTQAPEGEQKPRITALLALQEAIGAAMDAGKIALGNVETTSDVFWAAMHGVVALGISMPMFDTARVQNMAIAMRETLLKAFYQPS
jgi:AcrR family transcriptional regulator